MFIAFAVNRLPSASVKVIGRFDEDRTSFRVMESQGQAGNPNPDPPKNKKVAGVVIEPVSSELPCTDRNRSVKVKGPAVTPVVSRVTLKALTPCSVPRNWTWPMVMESARAKPPNSRRSPKKRTTIENYTSLQTLHPIVCGKL